MAPSILGLASAILGIPTITTFIQNLISALTRNSEYIENVQCTRNQLQEFEDEDLLGKMSILLTPTGYSDGYRLIRFCLLNLLLMVHLIQIPIGI
jgi:hypothetical protein